MTPQPSYQEPVNPVPDAPAYTPPVIAPAPPQNTCHGYASQYCSTQWGQTYTRPQPGGGLCLQTGFAATPAWYYAACRNGGQVDPQVCSHAQIAKNPADYQMCIYSLNSYQQVTRNRRNIAGNIHQLNVTISGFQGTGQSTYGGSSETKSGSFKRRRPFHGTVISTLGPIVLDQYLSYQAQKNARYSYPGAGVSQYGPIRHPVPGPGGNTNGTPGQLLAPRLQPAPYYGPRYGYGFNYGGNYGATSAGLSTRWLRLQSRRSRRWTKLFALLLGGGEFNDERQHSIAFWSLWRLRSLSGLSARLRKSLPGIRPFFRGLYASVSARSIYGTVPINRPMYPVVNGQRSILIIWWGESGINATGSFVVLSTVFPIPHLNRAVMHRRPITGGSTIRTFTRNNCSNSKFKRKRRPLFVVNKRN